MFSLLPIILVVLVLAARFKIAFIFHVLYVLIAVSLLARASARYAVERVTFERTFEERGLHGEDLHVQLRVHNGGWLPLPWLHLRDRLPIALASPSIFERAIALAPGGTAAFTYQLHCRQRGWYELGPFAIQTGDVLGMNVRRREYVTAERLLVYPRILPFAALGLPSRMPFGAIRTHQLLNEDPSRVVGVRDYENGDSLRRIHWRTSAALGRLQVKKLEPAMTLHTAIALDLRTGAYDPSGTYYATELAIVVAASVANHLIAQRQEVGLISNGRDPAAASGTAVPEPIVVPPRKGTAQLTHILDVLARVGTDDDTLPLAALLPSAMGDFGWGTTIVVITGEASVRVATLLGRLRRAGFAPTLLLVTQRSAYAVRRELALPPGVAVHHIWRESDIAGASDQTVQRRAPKLSTS